MQSRKFSNTLALFVSTLLSLPISIFALWQFPQSSFSATMLLFLGVYSSAFGIIFTVANAILSEAPHKVVLTVFTAFIDAVRKGFVRIFAIKPPVPSGQVFIGRKVELNKWNDIIRDFGSTYWGVCIYGFGGIGKTTLLYEMARVARSVGIGVDIYVESLVRIESATATAGRKAPESLAGFLLRTLGIPEASGSSPFDQLTKIAPRMQNTIIVIDEYPSYDDDWNIQFSWLIDHLKQRNIKSIFVTSSRLRPPLPVGTPVDYIHLDGLSQEETQRFLVVMGWDRTPLFDEVQRNFETFYRLTQEGNPKIIQLLFSNPYAWEQINRPEKILREISVVDDLVEEIWNAIDNQELKENISGLVVVAHVSPEFPEVVARLVVSDWTTTRKEMLRRSLLTEVRGVTDGKERQFRIHDLFGDWVYQQLREIKEYHQRVGDIYGQIKSDQFAPVLRLYHYLLSENANLIQEAYSKAIKYMFNRGEIRQILRIIDGVLPFINDHTFSIRVMHDQAKALLLTGNIQEALERFHTVRELMERGHVLSAREEAELLMGIADSYRLSGDFSQRGKEYFALAATKFQEAGSEGDAIAAEIEYGHAFYMEGDAIESLTIYRDVRQACYRKHFDKQLADVYYRMSKSNRLIGKFEQSLEDAVRAEQLYEKLQDRLGVAKARWTKVSVFRMQGKYSEALKEIEFVKQRFEDTGYRASMFLLHDVAEIQRAEHNFDAALATYNSALIKIREAGDDNRVAHSLLGIAEVKRYQAQLNGQDPNPDRYTDALSLYTAIGSQWGIINTHIACALACTRDPLRAEQEMQEALAILNKIDLPIERSLIDEIRMASRPLLHPLNFV